MSRRGRRNGGRLGTMLLVTAIGLSVGSCRKAKVEKYITRPAGSVTYSKEIASILWNNCSVCHRPGQSGPFQLLTYGDAHKHGKELAAVTQRRYMPPWLPESKPGEFLHERSLTVEQIGLIQQWFADGMPEGNPAELPLMPQWNEDWQLGKPDLVVRLPKAYLLPADGKDVYRNLVIPIPLEQRRYVQAVEFRPSSRSVHHAFIRLDRTSNSRRLDAQDPEPGFPGMDSPKTVESPGGQFLSWQPGKVPGRSAPGLGWTLEKGTDLVVQCHLKPSGKVEPIQPSIAFYFTSLPPTNSPAQIALNSFTIDIPAGTKDVPVEDTYVLPVDVDLLGVLPHAHYLGKKLEGFALLPNGKTAWHFLIPNWDFNWQGDYYYAKPIPLPKGTRLQMRFTYDNSTNNLQNPNNPPKRVQYGVNTTDEMAELWLQLLPHNRAESAVLTQDYGHKALQDTIAYNEYRLRKNANDGRAMSNIAEAEMGLSRIAEAYEHFQKATQMEPNLEEPHYFLGIIYRTQNKTLAARTEFETTLRLNPEHAKAHGNLGLMMLDQGNFTAAEEHFKSALKSNPNDAIANDSLGVIRFNKGDWEEARRFFEAALKETPDDPEVQKHLAAVLRALGLGR
ncbi:MAG TPA: tetratricopeptide repeat protein [Candidatus Saccharimonadales bacterium]|nr:tetratricopeptide repeat protein [Candidatus Saccharimonadales bacterium]